MITTTALSFYLLYNTSTPKQSNGISLAMTVLLYLIGTSVGPVVAGIFMQMYQTTIKGIVGSFPASQSYN